MNTGSRKSMRILCGILITYALLVATHLGEFWPFSIYPMFSQAGNPWTRAVIVDQSNASDSIKWKNTTPDQLSGEIVATKSIGVDQIDFSNFVVKTKSWNADRVQALRYMLGESNISKNSYMVYKVHGSLVSNDGVSVESIPFLFFSEDTTLFNPNLKTSDYFIK